MLHEDYIPIMTGQYTDLDRRFRRATESDERPYEGLFDSLFRNEISWSELLALPRVVILAEAGSGKSAEFKARCAALIEAGKPAFIASVRDVAQLGLEAALPPADRKRLEAWMADDEAEGWFFLDSVDEAKDQGHHFETAVRNLATVIAGREERAHVLVSGRYTDWDATADREVMEKWLGMPETAPPPPPSFADEIRATLHRETKTPTAKPEAAVAVLVMAKLDRSRVLKFARSYGVADADAFLTAVDEGNLWQFAARPLDLEWMTGFWQSQGRLGTLREMIEASLAARLIDPDLNRRRRDPLDAQRAGKALNRIGASFLLCEKDSLRVPVSTIEVSAAQASLPLEAVLPDWTDGDRLLLLGRSVFDPATLGRTRLHNDNGGTLRCYLAARWLAQQLDAGCPLPVINDLLFADTYGFSLVRPDMAETAAWLAGLHTGVAEEVIARSAFLLTISGDPGSLPIQTRIKIFGAALREVATVDKRRLWFPDAGLRRFADPGLDPHIPGWWAQAGDDLEAEQLLLRLVWFGRQKGGLDLVCSVAFDRTADEITQLYAARALFILGNADDRRRFADHVIEHGATLKRSIVLEALSELCPTDISVDQFFVLVDAVGVADESDHYSVRPVDREMVEGFRTDAELTRFIEQILDRAGPLRGEGETKSAFREAFAGLAGTAALRLLARHPDETPDVVTAVLLLLHESRRLTGDEHAFKELGQAISATPGRRRTSFWQARERLQTHQWVQNPDDMDYRTLDIFGWRVNLGMADLDWLLVDMAERPTLLERLAAMRSACRIWREDGSDPDALIRLEQVAASEARLAEQLAAWLQPQPENPEIVRMQSDMAVRRAQNEQETEERDRSWIDMVAALRDDPSVFDRLIPQTEERVDPRLYHLWNFVTWRIHSSDKRSIESLDAVAPIFGPDLTRRFGDALIAFAYGRTQVGSADSNASNRLQVTNFDIMALGGMGLAAGTTPDWAVNLTPALADLAARLARVELNGFPTYLVPLAEAHPDAVRAVLWEDVEAQLIAGDPAPHGMLDKLHYADPSLSRLLVPNLAQYLEAHPDLDADLLAKAVSAIIRAMPVEPGSLLDLAERRAAAAEPVAAASYLLLCFAFSGEAAIDRLRARMASIDPHAQAVLCSALLPRLVGDRFLNENGLPVSFSVRALEQLLIIALEGVRLSEDIRRPNGVVFGRDARDGAQDARNAILDRLTKVPGEATHAALKRLEAIPDFPIPPERIRELILQQALQDSALAPWQPGDLIAFERHFDRAPTNTADLQLLARRRLEGIAHDLTEGKFAQGDTLQALENENAVQRWVANELEGRRKAAYTVQRETHVAGEKEPDIMLTSSHGAELPIEIKVVDEMTVSELEAALETQLVGQYLRQENSRHGILLLVYQRARAAGWTLVKGEPLVPFDVVLEHLHALARSIRERSATGPQPIVVALDVSQVVSLQAKRDATRAATAASKAAKAAK